MKKACVALIRDVDKGPAHLEAIPHLFDCAETVSLYAAARLNVLVTVVVTILDIEVADDVKLVSWI